MAYVKVVRDYNRPTICGIGYVGNGPHKAHCGRKNTREYNLWIAMMHRCYGKVYKRVQSYINCVVDSRWHNFQQFCEDIKELDGYSEWLNPENKMCLDKDTKVPGNGSYGPSTCVFLTKSANVKAKKRKTVSKAFQ